MKNQIGLLKLHLCEQIALEEALQKSIDEQIREIHDANFEDAKNLLKKTSEALDSHFQPLNKLLDWLDADISSSSASDLTVNGKGGTEDGEEERRNKLISRILRDDYSALNLITINNTLLHTTALALGNHDLATTALKHLENLAPLVVRLGELVPEIILRELRAVSPDIDPKTAQIVLKNIKLAWSKSSC